MNKDIKLVALDLDDTTLKSDSSLAPETYEALIEAAKAGIEIVVASGRAYTSIPKKVLEIESVNYVISSNGAAIEKAKTGERVYAKTIAPAVAESILAAFPDALTECFIEGQPYCPEYYMENPTAYGCSAAYVNYVQTTRKAVKDIRGFIMENISRLDSIDIICPDAALKAKVYERAKQLEGAYVTSSSPRLVEFAALGTGKGRALRELCKILGIASENVAAFGNGDNDADMLSFAGFGVAVKNATDYCKECADYICEANDDLGVAKTLYKLIKKEAVI